MLMSQEQLGLYTMSTNNDTTNLMSQECLISAHQTVATLKSGVSPTTIITIQTSEVTATSTNCLVSDKNAYESGNGGVNPRNHLSMSSLSPTSSGKSAFLSAAQVGTDGGISSSTSSPCLSVTTSTPSPVKSSAAIFEEKILNEYELYDEDAPTEDSELPFIKFR
jgi:hypothetical protein